MRVRSQWVLLTLMVGMLLQGNCLAASLGQSYFPPEVSSSYYRHSRFRPRWQINLNRASVTELKTLPGIDDNIALKLRRIRPLSSPDDLYRLPKVPRSQVNQLIQQIKPWAVF
jgi:hypothetical protein